LFKKWGGRICKGRIGGEKMERLLKVEGFAQGEKMEWLGIMGQS